MEKGVTHFSDKLALKFMAFGTLLWLLMTAASEGREHTFFWLMSVIMGPGLGLLLFGASMPFIAWYKALRFDGYGRVRSVATIALWLGAAALVSIPLVALYEFVTEFLKAFIGTLLDSPSPYAAALGGFFACAVAVWLCFWFGSMIYGAVRERRQHDSLQTIDANAKRIG